jgi:hypothetical protein
MDAAIAAPHRHEGCPPPFPELHPLSGASLRFSPQRQDGPGDSYMSPAASAGPLRASPPAHVCAPGRWNGRRECMGVGRSEDKICCPGSVMHADFSGSRGPSRNTHGEFPLRSTWWGVQIRIAQKIGYQSTYYILSYRRNV